MQKVKVGGTAYTILRGKTKIDGTTYTIFGGKTKVGGTGYAIDLSPVPSDYRRVKWIEATAKGPYIVLPFTTQQGLKVDFEVAFSSDFLTSSDALYYNVWGYAYSSGIYDQYFTAYKPSGSSALQRVIYRAGNSNGESRISDLTLAADTLYDVSVSASGTSSSASTAMTFNGVSTTATGKGITSGGREMRLFTLAYWGSTSSKYPGPGRIGRFTAYDSSNNVLCDLWPCYRRSDSVPGFWDAANQTFLYNSGTGSLSSGPTVIS